MEHLAKHGLSVEEIAVPMKRMIQDPQSPEGT